MSSAVDLARQQWAEGNRRVEAERSNPDRYRLLREQIEAVDAELRRRLGTIFSLAELADEYRRAERWAAEVIAELPPSARWAPGVATATDAAFHLYSRGARDYEP